MTSMLILAAALTASCSQDLAGVWKLSTPTSETTWDCPVPGDNASALLAAGTIPDPFVGAREDTVQWLGDVDWGFSRTFDASADLCAGGPVYLEFDSIDTVADIVLNGRKLGSVENEFRRWRFEVSSLLKPAGNRLDVRVAAPRRAAMQRWLKTPDYDIRSWACSTLREINALRKCQCTFGWDWGISLPVSGIYYGVRLFKPAQGLATLDYAGATSRLNADGSADVTVSADVTRLADGPADVTFELNGEQQSVALSAGNGAAVARAVFHLERPELWWPNGLGAQKLYPWTVAVDGQSARGRVGVRSLELVREKFEKGETFGFRVNGKDFFSMGADWIPCDAFPARRTPVRMRALLESARDANMNTVRVWGGGVYESEAFYDLCDELGLLVWQDFMFACGRYPARPDFLAEIAAEAKHQVKRISSHASLLLWCGDNECIGGVREPGRFQNDWIAWNAVLRKAVEENAPDAIWWPSSPCAGPGDFTYNEYTGASGDSHYWGVWHGARDFSGYYMLDPRFVSEFGYQSFPSLPTVRKFATAERDYDVASKVMRVHQKNAGGNEKMNAMMAKYFPPPRDFASRLYLSQVQQAVAIETAVAYWRSLWPSCRGAVVWQLNDWWPVASWSSLEYDGRWKPLHYAMRRFFAADYPAARRAAELKDFGFLGREIPATGIRIESVKARADGAFDVTVRTDAPAYFVWLEDACDSATRFHDNLLDLAPGAHVFVCRPGRPTTAEALAKNLSVRDLAGSVVTKKE